MSHPTAPSHHADGSTSGEGASPSPETAVPPSDPGEVGKALNRASPDDDLAQAAEEGSLSAGEGGRAADVSSADPPKVEVVIEKIPDPHDLTVLLWAARCSDPEHDLLGHFDSEEEVNDARQSHLALHQPRS